MMRYEIHMEEPIETEVWDEVASKVLYLSPLIQRLSWSLETCIITLQTSAELEDAYNIITKIKGIVHMEKNNFALLTKAPLCTTSRVASILPSYDFEALGYQLLGDGRVQLSGHALKVYQDLNWLFLDIAKEERAQEVNFPSLIPNDTLKRCGYFNHFPQNFGTVAQVKHEESILERFSRQPDLQMSEDMLEFAGFSLSPAICFHTFHACEDECIPNGSLKVLTAWGNCYRHEQLTRLSCTRLQAFSMREIVYIGGEENVLQMRTL